jgi:membrane-associated phospholipid phosphatase
VIALLCFCTVFLALWGATYTFFPPLIRGVRSGAGRLARWLRSRSRLGPLFGRLETWRSYLIARRRFRWAAYLGITAAGGALLNQLLKSHFVRQRPDLKAAVLGAMGYSFPSGHAMSATIILGALAYLAARSIRAWERKSAALAALATLALAIGISRIYLGVHWTSDVGAGFAAGLLWVTAMTTGYELFRQYRLGEADMAERRSERTPSHSG